MPPRSTRLALPVLVLTFAVFPLPVGAELAMRVQVPADAAIADVNARAGETADLCGPGERLRRDGSRWVCETDGVRLVSSGAETYQTFAMGRAVPGATSRFAATCLGREDRVLSGSCVRRAAGGYVSFAGQVTSTGGSDAVECALDGTDASSAVGIAICLDLPPLR